MNEIIWPLFDCHRRTDCPGLVILVSLHIQLQLLSALSSGAVWTRGLDLEH